MKKLMLGVAFSAALFTGAAQAVTFSGTTIDESVTTEIYLSGASAPLPFIEGLLTNQLVPDTNQLCVPNTTIYKYKDNGGGKDQNVYLCQTAARLRTAALGVKPYLAIYKRSLGGSAIGVNPLINGALVDFMKVKGVTCTTSAPVGFLATLTCGYYTTGTTVNAAFKNPKKPDFGVSDVDPAIFRGTNTPAGFQPVTAAQVATLTVKPAVSQTFGVAVSLSLRNALQTLQGKPAGSELAANQPSLTTAQIKAIFAGNTALWSTAIPGLAASHVHICRRTNGSGTGAQFAQYFYNYPTVGAAPQRAAPAGETATVSVAENPAYASVHQLGSAGQVSECLAELSAGTNTVGTAFNNTYGAKFAVGIQSTDANANNAIAWRFVKVDNVAPTLTNVNAGTYKDWYEVTYNYNTAYYNTRPLDVKTGVSQVIAQTGVTTVVQALDLATSNQLSHGQAGFQTVPGTCTGSLYVNKFTRSGKAANAPLRKCP